MGSAVSVINFAVDFATHFMIPPEDGVRKVSAFEDDARCTS